MVDIYTGPAIGSAALKALGTGAVTETAGPVLGAELASGFQAAPGIGMFRAGQAQAAETGILGLDERGDPITAAPEPPVDAAALETEFGIPGVLKFDRPMPHSVAQALYEEKRDKILRDDVIARRESGFLTGGFARTIANLTGGLPDPLGLAVGLIPPFGEARVAQLIGRSLGTIAERAAPAALEAVPLAARIGERVGLPLGTEAERAAAATARTAAAATTEVEGKAALAAMSGPERFGLRAATGGVQGGLGMAALQPIAYGVSQREQEDYTMADAIRNVALGSIIGGGLHATIGGGIDLVTGRYRNPVSQALEEAGPDARNALLRGSLADTIDGQPVTAPQRILDLAPNPMRLGETLDEPQPGVSRYPLMRDDIRVGTADIGIVENGKTAMANIIDGPRQLGLPEIRGLARQFFEANPEVDTIRGFRAGREVGTLTREDLMRPVEAAPGVRAPGGAIPGLTAEENAAIEVARKRAAGIPVDETAPTPKFQYPAIGDDPLAMMQRGELTAGRAAQVRDQLDQHWKAVEDEVFGADADRWRQLRRQSASAWDHAEDARAKAFDAQIAEIEARVSPEDLSRLDAIDAPEHFDPEIWKVIARNLEAAEGSRDGGINVIADQLRYLPREGGPKNISEREAVAVIGRAMQAEAERGGDIGALLDDAFKERIRRYGGGHDAIELAEDQKQRLLNLLKEPPPGLPAPSAVAPLEGSIADVEYRKLTAAGVPEEEARTQAEFTQRRYEARAARRELGESAEELYRLEGEETTRGQVGELAEGELGQQAIPSGPLGVDPKERALTVLDILSPDTPARKALSKSVEAIASELMARGKRALQALGIKSGRITGPSPRSDEIISRAMATEIKEALQRSGHAGDWYTAKVDEAMRLASKIYPEIATDPNAKSAFTAALAITSQGETVPSNVRLADQVYSYYRENGRFPTDVVSEKGPSMNANFTKLNKLLDDYGPAGMRELLSRQFTVRELEQTLGIEIGGENKDTRVYGSAILGPKIGQGFYQNLNGNYAPVTMDLWFMRAWGRLTGTLVGMSEEALAKQRLRLETALEAAGQKVPKTAAALERRAEALVSEHERNFRQYRDQYNSGERAKAETVYAAERFLKGRNGLNEAPSSGGQRDWIRARVNRARELLAAEGTSLTNADLQAAWWYPEKDLYGKLGGRDSEAVNVDYATAWRDAARRKGLSDADLEPSAMGPVERRSGSAGEADVARATAEDERGLRQADGSGVGGEAQAEPGPGGETGPAVTFEVAPDPRNPTLVARWGALPTDVREQISHSTAERVTKQALDDTGTKGELQRNNGAWLDDPNPSLSLQLDAGTDPAKVSILSRLLGYALRQEETLHTSPHAFPGGAETGTVIVDLPRGSTPAQIQEVWRQIREIADENGNPYALGHTTGPRGGMVLLNNNDRAATIGTEELARLIDEKLGGRYDVKTDTLHAERVQAGSDDYGLSRADEAGGIREAVPGSSLRQTGDNLRAEAQQHIDEQLRAHESLAESDAGTAAAGEPGAAAAEPGATGAATPELEQAGRAKVRLSTETERALITLYEGASDASSLIHEKWHVWTDQLFKDAAMENAPRQLVEDAATLRREVGAVEGEPLTREQLEQLATWGEQYLREGKAPTPELEGVFARFKQWMTEIYQTIKDLGVPINDDVRGVFDRMLTTPEQEARVAGEVKPGAEAPPRLTETAARPAGEPRPTDTLAEIEQHATELEQMQQRLLPEEKLSAESRAEMQSAREAVTEAEGQASALERAALCIMRG